MGAGGPISHYGPVFEDHHLGLSIQYKWWELFCLTRGLDPIRQPKAGYDKEEEQIFLDFIVHSATNEKKAPGTVKLRLAAVRSFHLTMGLPDLTMSMPRLPLALAGLKRRYGTKERRKPVTPAMLTWLGLHLQFGKTAEGSLLWAAICFGYFFLLRASEYLGVGYTDPNRGLRGRDVILKEEGVPVGLERIGYADEVVLTIRGSKTDIYNRGEVRNHFRSGDVLCPVSSAVALFMTVPPALQQWRRLTWAFVQKRRRASDPETSSDGLAGGGCSGSSYAGG